MKEALNLPNIGETKKNAERQTAIFKALERRFYDRGIIDKKDGLEEFDLEALRNLKISGTYLNSQVRNKNRNESVSRQDLLDFFTYKFGLEKTQEDAESAETETDDHKKIKPFFSLPESIEDAKEGNFQDGLLAPWELMYQPDFRGTLELESGERISLAELFYLKRINELKFQRDEDGVLKYFNEDDNKFEKFNSGDCDKIFGRDVSFKEDGKIESLTTNPEYFIKKYLPSVDSLNVFQEGDFKRVAGTRAAESLFKNDKKFNSASPYYGTSMDNDFVRYYVGRDKIVGTDKRIEDNMFLRELSKDLVGVIQEEHGRKRLLYTFKKLSNEEFRQKGFADIDNDRRIVGGKEMNSRVNEYKISEYLPRRSNETPEAYADRLANLNDIDFVTDKFRELMSETGVPLRQLSWPEQLAIANYSLEGNQAKDLADFTGKYGIDGLRTFLAVEGDKATGKRILEIGKNLEAKEAQSVFSKISELVVLANKQAQELSTLLLKDDATPEATALVYQELLKKSNIVLEKLDAVSAGKKKNINVESLVGSLGDIKTENIILSAILKSAREGGQKLSLETIKNLNLEKREINESQGIGLSKEEKSELLEIVKENYQSIFLDKKKNYNPEAYNRVISDFEKELEDLDGQTVYILKYQNKIVCFNRFKKLSPYEVYAASFNVVKDVQGLSIGKSFLDKTLQEVSKNYDIRAKSRKDNPANAAYERQGFAIVGEHEEKDGVAYYDLLKPSSLETRLEEAA